MIDIAHTTWGGWLLAIVFAVLAAVAVLAVYRVLIRILARLTQRRRTTRSLANGPMGGNSTRLSD